MSMVDIREMKMAIPANDDAWAEGIMEGVTEEQCASFSNGQYHTLARMMANAFGMTRGFTMHYVQQVAENIVEELDKCASHTDLDTMESSVIDNITSIKEIKPPVANLSSQVVNLNTQMAQLPVSAQSSGGTRHPKIGEPPEFNGIDGKVKFQEWMNKIQLWVVHENIVTDKHHITVAMNKLSGSAAQYMEPWIEKLTSGKTIGSWDEFVHKLAIQYGQRDEKEGAKKELTALFINIDLAHKNFVKYAEKFRTLGCISGYEDSLLIDKLSQVIEKDMCLALIGYKSGNNIPTKWGEYLDLLLEIFKDVHPDKAQGHIFGRDKGPSDTMDVDSVETKASKGKKGKGKAKEQINNNGEKEEKFCHICNHPSHNTIDCYNNAKGPNYKPCSDEKKGDKKKSPEDKKKSGKTHKIRSAETKQSSDSSDSEDDTPRASTSKEINSAEIDHPKIRELSYSEELTSDDEPFVPQSVSDWSKGKKKVSHKQGFSRRHM
ncbi:hypothetical protein HWV62_3280 [Athelia sp. TMB]|nr:hypothetical protein HWV62_3280 [Athelia sp. TMB]